jgi:RND superfamily putative drug exporter
MDAFIIRGTLVPAFMRLAGEANWWAPKPLRRFHDRYGFTEHIDLDAPERPDTKDDTDDRADEPDLDAGSSDGTGADRERVRDGRHG